jgi:hypothetical protein
MEIMKNTTLEKKLGGIYEIQETKINDNLLKAWNEYAEVIFPNLLKEIEKEKIKVEEDFIKKIIAEYIGRKVTMYDAPRCTRVFRSGDNSKYILCFDRKQLGMVYKIDDGCNFSLNFQPNDIKF